MKIKIHDIEWDTDGELPEKFGLPTEVILDCITEAQLTEDEDAALADHLSDEYGFCVKNFYYTVLQA